jgi:Ubiquitin-2 like Rad60 SUMO-like
MSDSSDESDIGDLFQQVHAQQQAKNKRKQQQQADSEDDDSSENGDDSDGDSGLEVQLLASRGRPKKKKGTVEEKLQLMSQNKAMRERQSRVKARKLYDSDDDDDEEDEIQVVETNNAAAAVTKKVTAEDSDSDDDDDVQCVGTTTKGQLNVVQQSQQMGAVLELQKLKAAADELLKSNSTSTQETSVSGAVGQGAALSYAAQQQALLSAQQRHRMNQAQIAAMSGSSNPAHKAAYALLAQQHALLAQQHCQQAQRTLMMTQQIAQQQQAQQNLMMMVRQQPDAAPLTLTLTINAKIRIVLSNETKEAMCVVTVLETEKVQVVIDKALQQLQLDPNTNVMGLQYNGHTLHNRQPLDMFGIPVQATLQATIHSSDFVGGGGSSSAAVADVGKLITVTLRRQVIGKSVEDCFKVGKKETLQALADRYAKANGLAKVGLHFDGDAMNLNHTPEAYDMEEEDLIDVVV